MPTIRTPIRFTLPLAAAALLLASGCATTSNDASPALVDDATATAIDYTVRPGDRLAAIALELTGDMDNWKAIAASNGIADPRSLRAGAVLSIPADLLPASAGEDGRRLAARESMRTEPRTRAGDTPLPSTLAVRRASPVKLSPVDVNRHFELSRLERETMPPNLLPAPASEPRVPTETARAEVRRTIVPVSDSAATGSRRVKVVGTYFPKGVYAQPASYSRLMMRVAPGTVFELEREVGDWYGVVTEDGIGYLRDSDGRLVEERAERAAVAVPESSRRG